MPLAFTFWTVLASEYLLNDPIGITGVRTVEIIDSETMIPNESFAEQSKAGLHRDTEFVSSRKEGNGGLSWVCRKVSLNENWQEDGIYTRKGQEEKGAGEDFS